jgi:hypothetical protein
VAGRGAQRCADVRGAAAGCLLAALRRCRVRRQRRILAGRFEFPSDVTLSEDARSLVHQLLVTDSIGRLSAKGALREPWLVER